MTSQPNRLAQGGLIDRGKTVRFSFDGRQLVGHQGVRPSRARASAFDCP